MTKMIVTCDFPGGDSDCFPFYIFSQLYPSLRENVEWTDNLETWQEQHKHEKYGEKTIACTTKTPKPYQLGSASSSYPDLIHKSCQNFKENKQKTEKF